MFYPILNIDVISGSDSPLINRFFAARKNIWGYVFSNQIAWSQQQLLEYTLFFPKIKQEYQEKVWSFFLFHGIASKSVLQGTTILAHQSLWKIKMLQWPFFRYCFKYLRSLRRYYPSIGSTRIERNAYRIVLNNNKKLSPSKFFLSKVLFIKSCNRFLWNIVPLLTKIQNHIDK